MPKLNEYIGSVVSSITDARVMSDLQTARIAEEYAKHQLLSHFPIPRMCIEDIELTIPIALETIQQSGEKIYRINDTERFNDLVYREISANLEIDKIPDDIAQTLKNEITKKSAILEKELEKAKDLSVLSEFSKLIVKRFVTIAQRNSLIEKERQIDLEAIQKILESKLEKELTITSKNDLPMNVNVIVESHKLQELKPENLILIKMKITEDRMEWHRMENSKGEIESKLLPE